ncbi:MAG: chemotaxis protein [Anaerovoracaceae bacterium]
MMPRNNPKPQTIASAKWNEKAGWMSKSYKLKREVVEAFSEACEQAGVSQAGKLTELMKGFIDEVGKTKE